MQKDICLMKLNVLKKRKYPERVHLKIKILPSAAHVVHDHRDHDEHHEQSSDAQTRCDAGRKTDRLKAHFDKLYFYFFFSSYFKRQQRKETSAMILWKVDLPYIGWI